MALDAKTKAIFDQIDAHGGMSVNPLAAGHSGLLAEIPKLAAHVTAFTAFYTANQTALDALTFNATVVGQVTTDNATVSATDASLWTAGAQAVKEFSPRTQMSEQYVQNMKILERPTPDSIYLEPLKTIAADGGVHAQNVLLPVMQALDAAFTKLYAGGATGIATNVPLVKTAITNYTSAANTFKSTVPTLIQHEKDIMETYSSLSGKVFMAKILPTWNQATGTKAVINMVATDAVKNLIK